MNIIQRWVFGALSVVPFWAFPVVEVHAVPLYSVTDLGPASPSAAYLNGQAQLDPTGNYLPLLSPSQQTAFQAGSFDIDAHPATGVGGGLFYLSSGGDIVNTITIGEASYVNAIFITSNNVGLSAGTGKETDLAEGYGQSPQLVVFTSDPHTVTYPNPQIPWETTTVQSPGYLRVVWATETQQTLQYEGQVAGINDHGGLALTEVTYPGPSYQLVMTPHVFAGQGDISLGSLGGVNGVADALNNSNQVVGWSQTSTGAQHAFLYSNGAMQDLNLSIPALSGITLVSAVGIDSAGDIVAYGTNANGQLNEYYLSPAEVPAPEPSTLAIMSVMIVAVTARAAYMRSRNR